MAQILITNYTGTVTSDIVACEANPGPTIGTCYNLATLYGTAGQISPTTSLPAWYTLPNNFDYDTYCYIQLSASTTLFTVPQLIQCGVEPPETFGFESCGQPLDKNIYVFYDASGSYPDGLSVTGATYETLSGASQSIRNWYYDLVNDSGYTGNLYEIPINNERYLNWACYPYLGSTTGGTLSDSSTVNIEMGYITKASNPNATPVWTSPIIRRIALGQDLSTGNPLPSSPGYSLGVPYDHSVYSTPTLDIGQFDGGDTNYISIIVLNEASGNNDCFANYSSSGGTYKLQSYHLYDNTVGHFFDPIANTFNPNNPQPYIYIPDICGPWLNYTNPNYSGSSIQRDYESWIKVWEDVNINLNGFAKVFLFAVPTKIVTGAATPPAMQSQGFGTLYQAIELIEGEVPQAPSYFQSNYCDNFNSTGTVWPYPNARYNQYSAYTYNQGQYYDFSPLGYVNRFTGLTATTSYQNLPTQYQNGPGLKNFGWTVDATVTGFTQALVENDLNYYLTSVLAGTKIYTTSEPTGVNEGNVYTIQDFEGCWTYTGPRLDGQPSYVELNTIYEFTSCSECQGDVDPQIVSFKYNGFKYSFQDVGLVSTGGTLLNAATIAIHGIPNDIVDIQISWPLDMGSDISGGMFYLNYPTTWTQYTLGTTTGITVTLDNNGVYEIEWRLIGGNRGYEYINFEITGSTGSATISPTLSDQWLTDADGNPLSPDPDTYSLVLCKYSLGLLTNNLMVIGESSVTATTSGTACSSFATQQSYLITGLPNTAMYTDILSNNLITNSLVLKNAQTLTAVNGTNNWIAVTIGMYYVDGYSFEKIALQVDSSGNIIDIEQC